MADEHELDLTAATAAIEQATTESAAMREQIQMGIRNATNVCATLFQHDVDPEFLCAVLTTEVHHILIAWGAAQGNAPDQIQDYYNRFTRTMRKVFTAQLVQAARASVAPQQRIQ